jgi:hypothetical protein
MADYYLKYSKYKQKYLELKELIGSGRLERIEIIKQILTNYATDIRVRTHFIESTNSGENTDANLTKAIHTIANSLEVGFNGYENETDSNKKRRISDLLIEINYGTYFPVVSSVTAGPRPQITQIRIPIP